LGEESIIKMPEEKTTAIQRKLAEIRRQAEERDAERRAKKTGLPYIDPRKIPISLEALKLVPEAKAKEAKVAPLEIKTQRVALAVFDPQFRAAQETIQDLKEKKYELKIFIASMSGLLEAWRFYKFIPLKTKEITGRAEIEKKGFEEFLGRLHTFQAVQEEFKKADFKKLGTTDLFRIIFAGALANKASDVHLEAEEKEAKIRYRLDGILHDIFNTLPLKNYTGLISRIKLLSGMKLNIHSEPQDGRFTINIPDKEIEVRVSIIPSEFGETVVMRILDPAAIMVDLLGLGLREDDLELVEREIIKPHGLILNTGPTGSGKTTTLYAFLRKLNNPEIKVITIEDPIEYRIPGIEQTQVDPEAGYTFANGLRAIVRQDPDVILVGEIRDAETADIAMQASLTGHMVLSTLHTNDAVGAVPRLVNLGVKPATIGPALTLVIAQRLVRKLCEQCKKPIQISAELKEKINGFLKKLPKRVKKEDYKNPAIYESKGCPACNNFGFRGRIGIFEFLKSGPDLEEAILKEVSEGSLRRLAEKQEMVGMQTDGILKVLKGITTFKEVEEVTGPIEW
jgi:type IV pilus assembly protein PilB